MITPWNGPDQNWTNYRFDGLVWRGCSGTVALHCSKSTVFFFGKFLCCKLKLELTTSRIVETDWRRLVNFEAWVQNCAWHVLQQGCSTRLPWSSKIFVILVNHEASTRVQTWKTTVRKSIWTWSWQGFWRWSIWRRGQRTLQLHASHETSTELHSSWNNCLGWKYCTR